MNKQRAIFNCCPHCSWAGFLEVMEDLRTLGSIYVRGCSHVGNSACESEQGHGFVEWKLPLWAGHATEGVARSEDNAVHCDCKTHLPFVLYNSSGIDRSGNGSEIMINPSPVPLGKLGVNVELVRSLFYCQDRRSNLCPSAKKKLVTSKYTRGVGLKGHSMSFNGLVDWVGFLGSRRRRS